MADIELVIKIDEKYLEYIHKAVEVDCTAPPYFAVESLWESALNGTPLPKGHGKLIAEPTEEDITKTVGGQNDFAECIKDAVKAVFDNADAIIEANKEQ